MNREILFRAKATDSGEFDNPELIGETKDGESR